MSKFLKQGLIGSIVFMIIISVIAELSLLSLRKSNFYKPSFAAQLEDLDYDYVVLGSSTGLTTVDTKLIDSLSGQEGVNLSMDDTALPSHYLMLLHFLKTGHHTNKVILSITPWDISESSPEIGNNDYRFLPFIHESHISQHFGQLSKSSWEPIVVSRFLPFVGLSYYNTELVPPSFISLLRSQKRNRFDDKGNYSYPNSSYRPKKTELKTYDVKMYNPYLKEIERLCADHSIELILYQSPIYNGRFKEQITSYRVINHIDLLDSHEYFYDRIHVNVKGREVSTISLLNSLKF